MQSQNSGSPWAKTADKLMGICVSLFGLLSFNSILI